MGQKVNPHGYRVGVIKDWSSKWYAQKKDFADFLVEDNKIRTFLKKTLFEAGISDIEIERTVGRIRVTINAAKVGMVIGKGGTGIDNVKKSLEKLTGKKVLINVVELSDVALDAQVVAEQIASDLERRITFRRAMKQAISRTMKAGAKGIKTQVSGRLGGADIARSERYSEGTVPLQTLRADIRYGFAEASTTYGVIGVKVWIYRGEVLPGMRTVEEPKRDRNKGRRNDRKRDGQGGRRKNGNQRRGRSGRSAKADQEA